MPPTADIDPATYGKLVFAATLLNTSVGDVVRRLTERLTGWEPTSFAEKAPRAEVAGTEVRIPRSSPWVAIHKTFKNHRVEGEFNMFTFEVRLLSEPWGGKTFRTPTRAAVAVVKEYSPDRATSNTNGRTFWILTEGGGTL